MSWSRLAPMRLTPFSYFWICWKVIPSAAPSFSWLIPTVMRRIRSRAPTWLSIGLGIFFMGCANPGPGGGRRQRGAGRRRPASEHANLSPRASPAQSAGAAPRPPPSDLRRDRGRCMRAACVNERIRRGGRAAEGARLESVYAGNRIAGSNPAPSASEERTCSRRVSARDLVRKAAACVRSNSTSARRGRCRRPC